MEAVNGNPTEQSLRDKPTVDGLLYIRKDLRNHKPADNLMFNERMTELQEQGKKVYHFGFGQSPFPIPEVAVQALRKNAHQHAYLPVQGIRSLREILCRFHEKHDGFEDLDPDDIILATGSKQLILLLMEVFSGDILLPSPCWTTYNAQVLLTGKSPVVVPCSLQSRWKITPAMLEQGAASCRSQDSPKLLVLCNPDNPTGISYNAEELQALSAVCRKWNILVLSDEIYARLRFDGNHCSIRHFYPEGTIVSTGFSKWMSAGGWRVGYHIFPSHLRALLLAVKSAASQSYSTAPAPMQYAILEALKHEKEIDDYIKHCRRILAAIAAHVQREITSVGAACVMPTAAYYCMINFDYLKAPMAKLGITTGQQFCEKVFEETTVALMPSEAFLRPETEFSTRYCYINFDGTQALQASMQLGLDTLLPEEFPRQFCQETVMGTKILKEWIQKFAE